MQGACLQPVWICSAPLFSQEQHKRSYPDVHLPFSCFLCCSTHAWSQPCAIVSMAERLSSFILQHNSSVSVLVFSMHHIPIHISFREATRAAMGTGGARGMDA